MSSFNLLSIGSQAAQAHQTALNTVGQNISNVNTDGYSRQRVDLVSRPDLSGVFVNDIERISDKFLTQQLWMDLSAFNQTSTYSELSSRLDDLLASDAQSVSTALDDYFGALQNVVDDPVSIPNRELFVAQADALVKRFNDLDANIKRQDETINQQIEGYASQVTTLTKNIADFNDKIRIAAANNDPANDLHDRRDELTNQLSELVGVTVVDQSSGEYSIFIGNGQPLVVGSTAHEVVSVQGNPDATQNELALIIAGNVININDEVKGGKIGGLLQYREEGLNEARDELGLIAIGLAESMNAQHQSGIDLNNQFGGELFKDMNTDFMQANRISANVNNQSKLDSARVEIQNVSDLKATDYELVFGDRNQMTLIRNSDGKQIQLTQLTDATADRTVPLNALPWTGNAVNATAATVNLDYSLNGALPSSTAVTSAAEAAAFVNNIPGVSGVTATTAATISGLTEAGVSSGGNTTFDLTVLDDSGAAQNLTVTVPIADGATATGSVVQAAIQAALTADTANNGNTYSNLSMTNTGNDVTIVDKSGGNIGLTLTDSDDTASFSVLDSAGASAATSALVEGVSATGVATGYLSGGEADRTVTTLDLTSDLTSATAIDIGNNVASTIGDTVQGVVDVDQGEIYWDPDGKVLSFAIDGIKVTIDTPTSFVKGDRFLIQPVRSGADDLSLVIQDGRQLALASPIRVTADSDNQGTGVATAQVTNPDAATFATPGQLSPPVEIVFNNPGAINSEMTYTIYDMSEPASPKVLDLGNGPLANQTYTAGKEIELDGLSIAINNAPRPGDRFSFGFNLDGVSDNRNALAISDLQQSDLFGGGSYQDLYGSLVERVGTHTSTARISEQANQAVLNNTTAAKASVSGVNLDEEAAKLVQFQQAYQASAQLIRISQTIFDSLLNSI